MRVTVASVRMSGAIAELVQPVRLGWLGKVLHRRDACRVVFCASGQPSATRLNILYIRFIRYILFMHCKLVCGAIQLQEGIMEHPQVFSHGLLYSISPQDISSLHLQEGGRNDQFDWNSNGRRHPGNTISLALIALLKKTAAHWGPGRH